MKCKKAIESDGLLVEAWKELEEIVLSRAFESHNEREQNSRCLKEKLFSANLYK